jgi:hypothetical protein
MAFVGKDRDKLRIQTLCQFRSLRLTGRVFPGAIAGNQAPKCSLRRPRRAKNR